MRVPGLIKWPRVVKAGSVISGVTSLLDIVPTVRDIVAKDSPESGDYLVQSSIDGV